MFTTPRVVLIALCAALNFALGSIVFLIKLPIYLDSIGTILCALLMAPRRSIAFICAALAGLISSCIAGLLINPFLPWFALTDVAIALVSAFVTARGAVFFRTQPIPVGMFAVRVISYGVVTGIVAAVVSAPVVAYLFGGVTGSGSALVVAYFLKTGQQLMNATLLSGLTAEPIDKSLQVLLAVLLYRVTPGEFIDLVHAK